MTNWRGASAPVAAPDADLARLLQTEERLAALLLTAGEAAGALVTAARLEAEQTEAAAKAALASDLAAKETALRAEGEVALVALRAGIGERRARLARIDPQPLARQVIARLIESGPEAT
ncbi:MAG: hypothetical protein ABI742_09455 [Gemmatimonadota bacterium]